MKAVLGSKFFPFSYLTLPGSMSTDRDEGMDQSRADLRRKYPFGGGTVMRSQYRAWKDDSEKNVEFGVRSRGTGAEMVWRRVPSVGF